MCTVIVALFVISCLPIQINLLYLSWGSNRNDAIALMSPLFILASLNSGINPIVYGFMWKPMRATLEQVCCDLQTTTKIRPMFSDGSYRKTLACLRISLI